MYKTVMNISIRYKVGFLFILYGVINKFEDIKGLVKGLLIDEHTT